jgi:hypothetical protein
MLQFFKRIGKVKLKKLKGGKNKNFKEFKILKQKRKVYKRNLKMREVKPKL